jgi:hypothetical protein
MTIFRRQFIGDALAAGAALHFAPVVSGVPQSAGNPRPFLLLRAPGDTAYVEAVRAAGDRIGASHQELLLEDSLIADVTSVRALFVRHRDLRMIGMMDSYRLAIVEETIRDLGGSVFCRGQHAHGVSDAAVSRHKFYSTPGAHGIGHAFAGAFAGARGDVGADVRVEEVVSGSVGRALRPAEQPIHASSWADALGQLHARLAACVWQLRQPQLSDPAGPRDRASAWRSSASIVALV